MVKGKLNAGTAVQRDDGKWDVEHPDGSTEVLTDKQFHQQFDVEGEVPEDKPVESTPQQVRPNTTEGEKFTTPADWVKDFISGVEAELKHYEDGCKNVRAAIKDLKAQEPHERSFAPVRHALHELSHGNPLTRVANGAHVPHDGPERLQGAPFVEDTMNSGPGEESNADFAGRPFGH
jgi:hypothetical protein